MMTLPFPSNSPLLHSPLLSGDLQSWKKIMFKLSSSYPDGEVWDHKGKTEIAQVFISYKDVGIKSLHFLYVDNESLVLSKGSGDSTCVKNFNTVTLNYPDEYLTSISGTYKDYVVTSITFGTNRGSYGPFGHQETDGPFDNTVIRHDEFNFQLGPNRCFGGFHGSTTRGYLETIGVYVKPIETLSDLAGAAVGVKKERNL